jgi:hypothetical protein
MWVMYTVCGLRMQRGAVLEAYMYIVTMMACPCVCVLSLRVVSGQLKYLLCMQFFGR